MSLFFLHNRAALRAATLPRGTGGQAQTAAAEPLPHYLAHDGEQISFSFLPGPALRAPGTLPSVDGHEGRLSPASGGQASGPRPWPCSSLRPFCAAVAAPSWCSRRRAYRYFVQRRLACGLPARGRRPLRAPHRSVPAAPGCDLGCAPARALSARLELHPGAPPGERREGQRTDRQPPAARPSRPGPGSRWWSVGAREPRRCRFSGGY